MASNTQIFIKRSEANNTPGPLHAGELAYSYASNTLFIGANTQTGPGYLEIGGWSDLSNLDSGTYGSTTAIPVITVDQHGKITNVYTQAISTTLTVAGDTGTDEINLADDTLTIAGGDGITTTADGTTTVTIEVDNTTVVRANTNIAYQKIDGDIWISGNLQVQGNTTQLDIQTLNISDPLIYLAGNNYTSDVVDIGFVGNYFDGTTQRHTGVFRHAGNEQYYIFDNYNQEPSANTIDPTDNDFRVATLNANIAAKIVTSDQFLAANGEPTGTNGFSFQYDGGYDTGMFSPSDGILQFWSNNVKIVEGQLGEGLTLENGAKLQDTDNDSLLLGYNVQQSGGSKRVTIGWHEDPQSGQSWDAIAIGSRAGTTNQSDNGIAIGNRAGNNGQSESAVAIGSGDGGSGGAGQNNQGYSSVAIGNHAAVDDQGQNSVAIGHSAAQLYQGQRAVALGYEAGYNTQQDRAVAIGTFAGYNTQGYAGVAIGYNAANGDTTPQGDYAVAIGAYAGVDSQVTHSIAINASGSGLNPTEEGLYINPIRANNAVGGNVTTYNTTTKEVVYTDVKVDNSGITLANGTVISDGESGFFVDSLTFDETPLDSSNIVLYNASTGELTYGSIGDLNPAQLSNGVFSWIVSDVDGSLYSNVGTQIVASANSVVIGAVGTIDTTNASTGRVAIGEYAGQTSQSDHAVAVGSGAGNSSQSISAIAIGQDAGAISQSFSAVAIGRWAGETSQGWNSVAVGRRAGRVSQGGYSVAMGWGAGVDSQGTHSVAIGDAAGAGNQNAYAVAIGSSAGNTAQGWGATAIGTNAGIDTQGTVAVAVGSNAGRYTQSQGAVAVGRRAGETTQGYYSVAMGNRAGRYQQGDYSVAIGAYAGDANQAQNSIVLNASGSTLNGDESGLYINPVRYEATQDAVDDGIMFYNQTTKEVRYSYALDGGTF
jgi:hypothetical protein